MRGTTLLAVAAWVCCAGAAVLLPRIAFACSGLSCDPEQFLPRAGSVPANVAALVWWPGVDWFIGPPAADGGGTEPVTSTAGDLRFECVTAGQSPRAIEFDVEADGAARRIRPRAALHSGEACSLSSNAVKCDLRSDAEYLIRRPPPHSDTGFLSGRAAFQVVEPAPLPAALGQLRIEPAAIERIELSEGGGCSAIVDACVIRAEIELTPEASPWRDAFVYETWVDGTRWSIKRSAPLPLEEGGSYLGRGRDLFFESRPNSGGQADVRGLSSGRHSVEIRASLPGTDLAIAPATAEIDLDCGFEPRDAGPAGRDAEADSGSRLPDAAAADSDAGEDGPDAAVARPGKSDAGTSKPARPRLTLAKDSSCAVAANRARSNPPIRVVLAALGIWAVIRRRRYFKRARAPSA